LLRRIISAIKFWCAILLTLLLVLFAVVNREFIDISLFPFPYDISLPKFLIAIICFGAGLIVGGLLMSARLGHAMHDSRKQHKRVDALENEVKSLHNEQHVPLP
jgi:uncharacterized integral membrane protein